ncbi:MAG: tyrosine-protein phosphatase [Anaerolineales bacterium]|nr:tyrosine-protein phosphatase [Anaerolineales bacterium]
MAVKRTRLFLGAVVAAGAAFWILRRRPARAPIDPATLIVPPDGDDWRSRFLPLPTAVNLRDIGGYRTAAGHTVRSGRIYRAGSLAELSRDDQQALADLGLKQVIDLRTPKELEQKPDRIPAALQPGWAHVPVYVESNSSEFIKRMVLHRGRVDRALAEGYCELIDRRAPVFGDILTRLSRAEELPALIHCTAGKDRTGIAIALLLLALGVSEADAVADYSLTNHHAGEIRRTSDHDMRRIKRFGFSEAAIQPLVVADPENMRLMIAHLYEQHGDVERYLTGPARVTPETLERLRAELLIPG